MTKPMTGKLVSLALLAALAAGPALADLRAPAETPPASFKGQQYVDSKGCVFVRAGKGKNTNWVPRIQRGKQMCNASPSSARAAVEANSAETAEPAAPKAGAQAAKPAASAAAPAQPKAQAKAAEKSPAAAPQGYKSAWSDDRLNPGRGGVATDQSVRLRVQLADGSIALRDAVVVSVEENNRVKIRLRGSGQEMVVPRGALTGGGTTQDGGSSGPVSVAAAGTRVQIGSFGETRNAERAAAKLAGLGLPVMRNVHRGLEVISVGPFASRADADVALSMARRAGFSEAVVVP